MAQKFIEEYVSFENYAAQTKTFDESGNVVDFVDGMLNKSYIWKQLTDYPIILGITKGVKSDHVPHYHSQSECYYVISGSAKTLCNNQYVDLVKGQYFFIPGNCVHNTPITSEEGLSIFYWFPQPETASQIKYCYKEPREIFDQVEKIRLEYLPPSILIRPKP